MAAYLPTRTVNLKYRSSAMRWSKMPLELQQIGPYTGRSTSQHHSSSWATQRLTPYWSSVQAVTSSCSVMPVLSSNPFFSIRRARILVSVTLCSLCVELPMNQGLSVKSFLISSRGNCFVSGSIAQKKTALVKLQTYMEDIRYWKRA